jgi:hypothetical protein
MTYWKIVEQKIKLKLEKVNYMIKYKFFEKYYF